MKSKLAEICNRIANRMGYRLEPIQRSHLRQSIAAGAKLYVGCGEDQIDGYVGCDLRPLEHIALACKAWEVSEFCSGLSEIYSRHMLEHLTLAEAHLTLKDWHRALQPGGEVRIEVPNLKFAVAQWERAEWTQVEFDSRFSDASWGFANLFGWQRECDPTTEEYNTSYWDVHKSGYTAESIKYFLTQAGFDNINITFAGFTQEQIERRNMAIGSTDNCHLRAVAQKPAVAARMAA